MQEKVQRSTTDNQESFEDIDTRDAATNSKVDLEEVDKLLDEIDELLDEVDAEQEAESRKSFRDKIRSLAFLGKRAVDPCAGLVSVPEYMAEAMLSAGVVKEPDCIGCE